jgi:NitT/TauT family transport system substrate-binding protein
MLEHIKIWGVKDPNISSQLILAKKLGYFEEEGLNVTYRLLQSGTMMPREILRAPVKPFAWTQTVITALILREQNLDVKIIAPLADISGTQQVVTRDESHIRSPQDLIGKKIGMAEGAAIYIALQNMANDFGIDLSAIEFVNLLPRQQLQAFKRGEIDAIACWEPWTTRAIESGGIFYFSGPKSNIPGNEGPVNWLIDQSMLMTTAEHIEQNQEILCAVIRAMLKATQFINEDMKDAARLLTAPLALGYFEARHMLECNRYTMAMDSMFRLGIFSVRELLYNSTVISTLLDEHELYTSAFLEHVDPNLVTIDFSHQEHFQIEQTDNVYTFRGSQITTQTEQALSFLLVDDSSVIRKILKDVVVALNGTLGGEAKTGREAIDQYKKLSPDVVMMDLSMPDMTGLDAIKEIFQLNPDANIIVLSGSNFPETRQEVFTLGVKMFISKPFDVEKVTNAIQSLLR